MKTKKPDGETISYTPEQYAALEAENFKLHKRILKLEAENVSLRNRSIAAIEGKQPLEMTDEELLWIVRGKDKQNGPSRD